MTDPTNIKESVIRGVFTGAVIFAVIFALLFGLTGLTIFGLSGIFGFFAGAILGLVVGAILGLIFGVMPPKVTSVVITILIIAIIVYLGFLTVGWYNVGAFQLFFGPLGINLDRALIGIDKGVGCIKDPVDCLFKSFYDWSEPTVLEDQEEEVSIRVDFSESRTVFFQGDDITVKSVIVVKNPLQSSYEIEAKCFIGGEEMEVRDTPRIKGGSMTFRKSDIEQRISIICDKKAEEKSEEEVETVKFELHLIDTGKKYWFRFLGITLILALVAVIPFQILLVIVNLFVIDASTVIQLISIIFILAITVAIFVFFTLTPFFMIMTNGKIIESIKESYRFTKKNYRDLFVSTLGFALIGAGVGFIPIIFVGQIINLLIIAPIQILFFILYIKSRS